MSPIKLSSQHRRLIADKLVTLGYATRTGDDVNPLYTITQRGRDFTYELARPAMR
jgi:hypothetical protein